MQSECNEKLTLKFPPCTPQTTCSEYEDYDPCESSDDINEKDLAILLKEEKAKLQEAKEKAKLQEAQEKTKLQEAKEKAKLQETNEKAALEEEKQKAQQKAKDKDEVEKSKTEYERTGGSKQSEKKDGGNEEVKVVVRKRCAKIIKNPFFGNRLEFYSDLPPPPPNPPPQFYPVPEEDDCKPKYPCPKLKKKCKKTKFEDAEYKKIDGSEYKNGENEVECTCEEDEESSVSPKSEKSKSTYRGSGSEWESNGPSESARSESARSENVRSESARSESVRSEGGQDQDQGPGEAEDTKDKWRRKCLKALNRPPCRKRDSDTFNPFQPRQIPARQNDLPAISPLELPEVERQIWMSADSDCPLECGRNNCQMPCSRKKCKRKKLSRADAETN